MFGARLIAIFVLASLLIPLRFDQARAESPSSRFAEDTLLPKDAPAELRRAIAEKFDLRAELESRLFVQEAESLLEESRSKLVSIVEALQGAQKFITEDLSPELAKGTQDDLRRAGVITAKLEARLAVASGRLEKALALLRGLHDEPRLSKESVLSKNLGQTIQGLETGAEAVAPRVALEEALARLGELSRDLERASAKELTESERVS